MFLKPAVHEGWGCVDSGFRRNDGGEGGRDLFRCSLNLLFMRVGGAWFPAFAGMTGGCRNDGGLGAGVHVTYTVRLSQCLAAVWGRRAVPEGWGCVVSGFRRNDGGGARVARCFRGRRGVGGPGSTSLTLFGCLSGWPRSGVDALSLRVGGAWIPAFAGMTGGVPE